MGLAEEVSIMIRYWFSVGALVLLSACSSGSGAPNDDADATADAIVGGKSDTKDPAVVAIDIGGQALCTGSLIGPKLVLTARHCVSQTSEEVQCPASGSQIEGEQPADTFTILVGSDIRTAKPVAIGSRVITPASDVLCEHDIALIELDRPVAGVTPLALGSLSGVKTVRGVGFGKRGDNLDAGKKMARANVAVKASSAAEFVVGVLSCNGDSGGPALDSKGRVVGVVSRGGPNCDGPNAQNIYTRTDAFHALIQQALDETAGSNTATGTSSDGNGGSAPECGSGKRCPNGSHCNPQTLHCESSR